MHKPISQRILTTSQYIFYGLLAYMPLHIFISTVIGANIGGLEFLKVFKDILALFGFCLILGISVKRAWFKEWIQNKLVVAVLAYALLTVLLAAFKRTDQDAEVLGVVYNLRLPLFLLYGWLLSLHLPVAELRKTTLKIVLGSGLMVSLFGVIQYLFLPNDALTHLGFTTANGVFPAFFIDNKTDLERVMSTLRDPNSLGSYLIIIIALVMARLVSVKRQLRSYWIGYGLAAGLCLLLTFSRSALLGLGFALVVGVIAVGQKLGLQKYAKKVGYGLVVLCIIGMGGFIAARNTYFVSNVIFHADAATVEEDPNELRVRFVRESLQDITGDPLGKGPGTAGLASIKNNVQGTKLTENYYLQIAVEVGIVGLILFIVILALITRNLWIQRVDLYPVALMASFAGLAVTNLLVHIWSNEAVAYTWWGLAGLMMNIKQRPRVKH